MSSRHQKHSVRMVKLWKDPEYKLKVLRARYGPDYKPPVEKPPPFTEEELAEFEAVNFRNAVHFYGEELRAIMSGTRALDLFTRVATIRLRKQGVLYVKNVSHSCGGRKTLCVTPEARALLKT